MATSGEKYLADFDSATAMLRALANFLHGRDFPHLGLSPALKPVAIAANLFPLPVRQEIYESGGYFETVAPRKLARIRDADIARWVVAQYPVRSYPAALVGSANGALVHLAAALGVPGCRRPFSSPCASAAPRSTSPSGRSRSGGSPGAACSRPTRTCSCTRCTTPTRIA